jgi:hypothetical protein
MSSIVESMKTGLNISLILIPKLILTTLGLVLVNTGALCLSYFAWHIWFPEKQNDAATIQENVDEVGPKPGHADVVGSCMSIGMLVTIFEGIAIFSMKDNRPKTSWVLRAGHIAGLVLGLGLGVSLVVLVGGGFTKMVIALDARHQTEMKAKWNEENAKEVGKGWEKLELKDKKREKEKGQ